MRGKAAVGLSWLLAGSPTTQTAACEFCAVFSAQQAQAHADKGFFAGAAEQFTHFGALQFDRRTVPNDTGQSLDSSISQVFAGYNFDHRFGLQFNLPVIARSFKRPEGFDLVRGTEFGLGDAALVASGALVSQDHMAWAFNWHVLGGVKFPTGDPRRLQEEFGEAAVPGAPESGIHGHDLTLGSGSLDGLVGTSLFARWHRAFVAAQVQYAIRSPGDYDYRFANDLSWSGGPGAYLKLGDAWMLSVQAVASGETKGRDTFRGVRAEDTGVTSVFLGPQIALTWSDKLSAQAAVDLPVSIDNTALQMVPDYRVRAAVTWHF